MLSDDELKQIWENNKTPFDALQAAAKLGAAKERLKNASPQQKAVERAVEFYYSTHKKGNF